MYLVDFSFKISCNKFHVITTTFVSMRIATTKAWIYFRYIILSINIKYININLSSISSFGNKFSY